ncbi:DNA ligase, NAD-dependent, partial [Chlamydia psittaci 06-1683]
NYSSSCWCLPRKASGRLTALGYARILSCVSWEGNSRIR